MRIATAACMSAVIFFFAGFPGRLEAQQWTSLQQEVWGAEVACLNSHVDPIDLPARKACMHPDFVGWGVQEPVPSPFGDKELEYAFARAIIKFEEATPLNILVEGDLAVIQLIARTVMSVDGGPDQQTWVAWTDIMKRDNGVWRWIADHGHALAAPN